MSYADKRGPQADCHWPTCSEAASTIALTPSGSPEWFCANHATIVKEMK